MANENDMKEQLVQRALLARRWSYSPYSHYAVGAALLTRSGKIYDGVNIENAAYPSGICAERVAVFKAVSEGERDFEIIAVVTENGGSPCGGCRQVLAEFGLETLVILADATGKLTAEFQLREIIPDAFTPDKLTG
jgi:cytidine deaminase